MNKPKIEIQKTETQKGNSLENSSSQKNLNTPPVKLETNWESNDPDPQPLIPVEPKKK